MPKLELDKLRCEEILQQAEVGYLSMCRDDQPYCIPFNFLYKDDKVYLHTGHKGKKWIFLAENPSVCFTVALPGRKKTGASPCQYSYEFESVMVFGKASVIDSQLEAEEALNWLVDKYKEGEVTSVPSDKAEKVCMIRIDVGAITGRQSL